MRKSLTLATLTILILSLSSCVSGSFRGHPELEEYPFREATKSEANYLRQCLQSVHHLQQRHKERTGYYSTSLARMPLDSSCSDFYLGIQPTDEGYEIMAQFHKEERTVRWTINQDGVMEEYLDQSLDEDEDLW